MAAMGRAVMTRSNQNAAETGGAVWCCDRPHPLLTVHGVRCTICGTVWNPGARRVLSARVNVTMTPETRKRCEQLAAKRDMSLTAWCREVIEGGAWPADVDVDWQDPVEVRLVDGDRDIRRDDGVS